MSADSSKVREGDEGDDAGGGFHPAPRNEWTLVSQGAEAKIWKLQGNNGAQWVCKERLAKAYRHPDLDERLTKSRCRSEARVLEKCAKKSEFRVPQVIRVQPPLLFLEYLQGPTLKSYLKDKGNGNTIDFDQLATSIGEMIGKLHNLGLVHGDLTTSNMIRLENENESQSNPLALIDFGLAKSTSSVEEQAVDLYVLERAFESTHPDLPANFMETILNAYSTVTSLGTEKKTQQTTLQRLEQVRQRGRKRECFG